MDEAIERQAIECIERFGRVHDLSEQDLQWVVYSLGTWFLVRMELQDGEAS